MKKRFVLGGLCGNSREIGKAVAERLGLPFYESEKKEFRDTEPLVRLPVEKLRLSRRTRGKELEGMDVIYIQSTAPRQSEHLIELFLTVENIKRRGARRLILVVPYLAHARQDREFIPGEVISKNVMGKIMKSLGVDHLITIDVHFNREVGGYMYEGIDSYNTTAAGALAKHIRDELGITSPRILIPDSGHKPIAEFITPILGDDIIFGSKVRWGETEVSMAFPELAALNGKTIVVFDDMISSGTTCITVAEFIKERKPKEIVLAVTHALYLKDVRDRLISAGINKIVAADTIPGEDSVVSVAPIITDALEKSGFLR